MLTIAQKQILFNPKIKSFAEGLNLVSRFLIGGLFFYAGILKLLDVKTFAKTISLYNLVPEQFLPIVAISLPIIEIVAGMGLIFNLKFCLSLITGLLIMFIVVLWYGILNNLEIDCGCFSQNELASHDSLRQALYRDLVMLAGCTYIYIHRIIKHGLRPLKII